MREIRQRRSPRRALELPIRVFGTDFQGKDFVEDSATSVVSRHGAKICLKRKLIPEQEIRILCLGNNREALFRVVSKAGEPTSEFSFWGVECLKPGENIWEGARPRPAPKLDPRPAPKLDPRPAPKLDSRPAPKLDPRLAPKLDARPAPKLGPRPGPKLGPRPGPQLDSKPSLNDKLFAQVTLRCPECGMRELIDLRETQIQAIRKLKGLVRSCPACGANGLWRRVSGQGP